jgi:hypothetical protein
LTVRLGESKLSSKPLLTHRELGEIPMTLGTREIYLQLKVCELELDRASPRALTARFHHTDSPCKSGVKLFSLVLTEIGRASDLAVPWAVPWAVPVAVPVAAPWSARC